MKRANAFIHQPSLSLSSASSKSESRSLPSIEIFLNLGDVVLYATGFPFLSPFCPFGRKQSCSELSELRSTQRRSPKQRRQTPPAALASRAPTIPGQIHRAFCVVNSTILSQKSPATSPPTFIDDHNTTPQASQTSPLRLYIPSISRSLIRYTQWHLYRQPICRWGRDCRDSPRHCSVRVPSHPIAEPRSLLLSPYIWQHPANLRRLRSCLVCRVRYALPICLRDLRPR